MHDNTFICCGVAYKVGRRMTHFYLLWSCLYGRMHDNTFICCGVVYIGGCMSIYRSHANTFICCGVAYMGGCMTIHLLYLLCSCLHGKMHEIHLSAVELSTWEDA